MKELLVLLLLAAGNARAAALSPSQQDLCTFITSARSQYASLLQHANSEPNALKRETLARQANAFQDNFLRSGQFAYMHSHHLKDFVAKVTSTQVGNWFSASGLEMAASFNCPNGLTIELWFHFVDYSGQPIGFRQTAIDTPFSPWRPVLETINNGDTVTITGDESDDGGTLWTPGLLLNPEITNLHFSVVLINGASLRKGVVIGAAADSGAEPTMQDVEQAVERGNLAQAQQMIGQVLRSHPTSAKAHYVAAEVDARRGDLAGGRAEFAKANQYEPGLPFAVPSAVQKLRAELQAE